MVQRDAWHIVNTATGVAICALGSRWIVHDYELPRLYSRAEAECVLADLPARCRDHPAAIQLAPQCGCCGVLSSDSSNCHGATATIVATGEYRCPRHIGRLPCCIDGCGRTIAIGGEGYASTAICGTHWRQAPRRMRDAVARVRRQARRRGWSDAITDRYRRLWHRTARAAREGCRLDEAEINALFGWGQ